MDILTELLNAQAILNDNVFVTQNIRAQDSRTLTMGYLAELAEIAVLARSDARPAETASSAGGDLNLWLTRYLDAMDAESQEVRAELLKKFWSAKHLNIVDVRKELIDVLHFWLSLALTSGLDAQSIRTMYMVKNVENLKRQVSGYAPDNT